MTKLVPGMNDFAMLQPLQWNTRYEVEITARNVKGLSEPSFYQFFMPQKPDITGTSPIKEECCSIYIYIQYIPSFSFPMLLAAIEHLLKERFLSFLCSSYRCKER